MYQYKCLNPISSVGLERLTSNYQVTDDINQADAILVRSASMHDMEIPTNVKTVARAGAGVNNIPLDKCLAEGCDKIVVVLTRPKGFILSEDMYLLSKILYPRDKNLQQAFKHRSERYNERLKQIERLEKDGRIFVIRPSETIAVSRLEKNPTKIQAAYDLGCQDAQALWPSLDCYLQSCMR